MPYNNPNPAQSSTLTDAERSREARKILELLRAEDADDLERRMSARAMEFVKGKWLEMDLGGGGVSVTVAQLHWLRDIWAKFA